jgi:hypothetical protein
VLFKRNESTGPDAEQRSRLIKSRLKRAEEEHVKWLEAQKEWDSVREQPRHIPVIVPPENLEVSEWMWLILPGIILVDASSS